MSKNITLEAQNLRRLRDAKDLTQEALAEALNFDKTIICKMETGAEPINAERAIALAAYFEVPLSLLYPTPPARRRRSPA